MVLEQVVARVERSGEDDECKNAEDSENFVFHGMGLLRVGTSAIY